MTNNRLKEIRTTRRLSQSELAKALEISRQAVSGFESGKYTPSLEMALKIAQILEVNVEEIFVSQEKNVMQTLVEKFTQWLPKGEKLTPEAIKIITAAQEKAAMCYQSQVEPKHLLYGLLSDLNTTGGLLRISGLTFEKLITDVDLMVSSADIKPSEVSKVEQFSPESRYILELALQLARLKQSKYIKPEHLLWGLVQFVQLGNNDLEHLFEEIDLRYLQRLLDRS